MSSATPGGGRHNRRGPPSAPANPSAESQIPEEERANIHLPEEVSLASQCWYDDKYNDSFYEGLPPRGDGHVFRVWALNEADDFVTLSLKNRARVLYDSSHKLRGNCFYTGIDSFSIGPVFMRAKPHSKKAHRQDVSNTFHSGNYKIAGGTKTAFQIIPPMSLLRYQALSEVKAHCAGIQRTDTGDYQKMGKGRANQINQFHQRQLEAFQAGHPCPTSFNDDSLRLDYAFIEDMKPESWAYFRMMMPKIGGKQVPKQLGEVVFSFLARYGYDFVTLNLAVSMCIVWACLVTGPDHGAELAAYQGYDRNRRLLKKVLVPSLASFILYAPHFFRLHEYYRLPAYIHIFRYVHEMYNRDRKLTKEVFDIDKNDINEELVKTLVWEMALQDDDWIEIVPPSWPGSLLPMPASHGPRVPQSDETTAALLLDDIHTLGFPNYLNESCHGFPPGHADHGKRWISRGIHVHQDWVPNRVTSVSAYRNLHRDISPDIPPSGLVVYLGVGVVTPYLPEAALDPAKDDWELEHLWTAPKTTIRRPWKDCVNVEHLNSELLKAAKNDAQPKDQVEKSSANPAEDRENGSNAVEQREEEGGGAQVAQPGGLELHQREGDRDPAAVQSENNPAIDHVREIHLIRDSVEEQELGDLNILPRPAHEAVAVEGVISDKDRRILRRLIKEDMADDKDLHPLSRIFRYIDVDNESLSKKSVIDHIDMGLKPLNEELEKINEYGRGGKQEENGFVEQVLKPCYELLGLKWPGTLFVAIDELGKLDESLVCAIIKLRAICESAPINLVQLGHATEKLQCSKAFLYIWRFCLLQDRLKGIDFASQEREKWWTKVFGKPYADE
ncbi:unnamed protein product [Colletotrichum noveboracense]|uniref:Uncharacterized protein n=1 Tax=Colletotrichum noveboracense TaxID=2664923 RepID=A0A9W4WKD1_9PEZI|nr:unnamed protein product [Colletotrichum noveboracense]